MRAFWGGFGGALTALGAAFVLVGAFSMTTAGGRAILGAGIVMAVIGLPLMLRSEAPAPPTGGDARSESPLVDPHWLASMERGARHSIVPQISVATPKAVELRPPKFDVAMRYQDAGGVTTERTVTINRLSGWTADDGKLHLDMAEGWCHLRRAERSFAPERIVLLLDPVTGEIAPDPVEYLARRAGWNGDIALEQAGSRKRTIPLDEGRPVRMVVVSVRYETGMRQHEIYDVTVDRVYLGGAAFEGWGRRYPGAKRAWEGRRLFQTFPSPPTRLVAFSAGGRLVQNPREWLEGLPGADPTIQ